jgi:hypothetical protein
MAPDTITDLATARMVIADLQGALGRIWTYLDPLTPQVVFDATPTHERDGPEAFLATFTGDLQADAYPGYDALYRTGRIRELGCWAHYPASRFIRPARLTQSGITSQTPVKTPDNALPLDYNEARNESTFDVGRHAVGRVAVSPDRRQNASSTSRFI